MSGAQLVWPEAMLGSTPRDKGTPEAAKGVANSSGAELAEQER